MIDPAPEILAVKRRRLFIVLAFLISLSAALPGHAQGPEAKPGASDTPRSTQEDALRRDLEQTLQKAQQAQEETRNQVSTILSAMDVFLGFLSVALTIAGVIVAIIIGVLSFLGFREWRDIHGQAKKAADAAAKAEQEAQRIVDWSASLSSAWLDIDAAFSQLPNLDFEEIDGMELELPTLPIGVSATFEDADVVLMLCDQLKIPAEREEMGGHFLRLVRFWLIMKRHPRALARAERAVALARQSAEAHRYLAWALANEADALPPDSPLRRETLQRALTELDEVKKLQGRDDSLSLYVRAWTLETQHEFGQAAAIYKEARAEDRKEAAQEGREEDWRSTYNLACSLAKAEQLDDSLNEVALFLQTWPTRWKAVTKDPDFETLRSVSPWQERFAALVEDAKRRAEGRS